MRDFFLGSAKTAFAALCLGVLAATFVKFLSFDSLPDSQLVLIYAIKVAIVFAIGAVVSAILLFLGYRLMKKEDLQLK
jgi:cation transporter-like permease